MMFWTRLGSSVVLVVLALIFLISGGPVLGAVCLLLSLTAYCELIKACHVEKDGKFTLLEIMGGCGIVLYGAAMMVSKNFLWGIGAIVLMFLAVMFVYVFHFPKYHADQVMTVFFCAFYPGVLFPFIYLTRELSWGKYLVWLIFISSWICDTCAYLTGMAIGKHKLAPVLSPKKSIEGAIGGVVGSGGSIIRMAVSYSGDRKRCDDLGGCADQCCRCSHFPGRRSFGVCNQTKSRY